MYHYSVASYHRRKAKNRLTRSTYLKQVCPAPKHYPGMLGSIYEQLYWMFQNIWHCFCFEFEDYDVEDLDIQVVRHKPQSLQSLVKQTKFTRKEIQLMYRGFKQGCPNGIVTLAQFKEIYAQFFPQGDSGKYAKFVFNTFDCDRNGQINFEEFVVGLSILSRGSIEDKIEWIFRLYDIHSAGQITEDELHSVVSSIYDMMGHESHFDSQIVSSHVKEMFDKMDKDGNGVITKSEFVKTCLEDSAICETLNLFDTIF